jgi:spoIIIJ-associated protein
MEPQSIEIRARTTDEAIRLALSQLGVSRDEVDIEILQEGRSGVFGVGSQDARVRVTVLSEDYDEEEEEYQPPFPAEPRFAPEPRFASEGRFAAEPRFVDVGEEEDEAEEVGQEEEEQPAWPTISEEDTEVARETLERMLDLLEFPNVVTVRKVERDRATTNVHLDVAGEDVGLIIGRHGETLGSLQFLLNACLSKQLPKGTRVIVDVEHYRDRREQSLRGIALRAADRASRERHPVTLQPMPPNERRIIHLTLQTSPYVTTESTGEGPERRVVITPKPRGPARRPGYGGGGGYNRSYRN